MSTESDLSPRSSFSASKSIGGEGGGAGAYPFPMPGPGEGVVPREPRAGARGGVGGSGASGAQGDGGVKKVGGGSGGGGMRLDLGRGMSWSEQDFRHVMHGELLGGLRRGVSGRVLGDVIERKGVGDGMNE